MTEFKRGDQVWWHDPQATTGARRGTVEHVEPDGQVVHVNPGPDIPTLTLSSLYVHPTEHDENCSFCAQG